MKNKFCSVRTVGEINMMKKMGNTPRLVTHWENDEQQELYAVGNRYDAWLRKRRLENEVIDKLESKMKAVDSEREKEIYLAERDAYCERMRQEEAAEK